MAASWVARLYVKYIFSNTNDEFAYIYFIFRTFKTFNLVHFDPLLSIWSTYTLGEVVCVEKSTWRQFKKKKNFE